MQIPPRLKVLLTMIIMITINLTMFGECAIVERFVEYPLGGDEELTAEGFLAYDDSWPGPMAAVLVVHQWLGLGTTEMQHARDLASHGIIGFAIDMFGKGCRGQPCGPATTMRLRADPPELRRRAQVGLDLVLAQNPTQVGANGYCFGGTVVLEMARVGMEVAGVVSFHGGLTPLIGDSRIPRTIGVQVHTGDRDPITDNELDAMMDEMRAAQLNYWSAFVYGNCAHGWTDPNSGAYRPREGTESHEIMFNFYKDTFKEGKREDSSGRAKAKAKVKSAIAYEGYMNITKGHRAALGTVRATTTPLSPLELARQEISQLKAKLAALENTKK